MTSPDDGPLSGDRLLAAVTRSMTDLHERYHGRRPVSVQTQLMEDELLVCVMGDVYTEVEKTMIEVGRRGVVRQTRSEFQAAMESKFIAEVERLSGRRVETFLSDSHVGPDVEVEVFMLAEAGSATR